MPIRGICKLCGEERDLLKSHYIPRALYPSKSQKAFAITAGGAMSKDPREQIKDHLLCSGCEDLFNHGGETEVLKWLAPRAKRFSLSERLRLTLPREQFRDIARYAAYDVGADGDKFAYFALSVIWRGAVHQWSLSGRQVTQAPVDLGAHEQAVREYLLGKTSFPKDVAVIVIVCSDNGSREFWTLPVQNFEAACQNYKFIARGVVFRVLIGEQIPPRFHDESCSSPRKCIFHASCAHRTNRELRDLFEQENIHLTTT
jgi:hypothetical protein